MIDLERGQIAGADSNTICEIARRFRIAAEASRAGRKPVTALVFDSLAAALDGDYARLARVAQ